MKRNLKITGLGICFVAILFFNIYANLNSGSSNINLASLLSIASADNEYGNGKEGFCSDGCPWDMIMIYCLDYPNSYCSPTTCTAGFCD